VMTLEHVKMVVPVAVAVAENFVVVASGYHSVLRSNSPKIAAFVWSPSPQTDDQCLLKKRVNNAYRK
jgi:hypothetical protein